jgi:hypothetical protein
MKEVEMFFTSYRIHLDCWYFKKTEQLTRDYGWPLNGSSIRPTVHKVHRHISFLCFTKTDTTQMIVPHEIVTKDARLSKQE